MRIWGKVAGLLAACSFSSAVAQTCAPTPEMHAVPVLGADGSSTASVAGDADLNFALDNGWTFSLIKNSTGWSIRLYQFADDGTASDLTSLTPPHNGAPNPRDIYGWHFRNAANTGPNEGDVNAPQHLRGFVISPGLAGTGGYKPSTDPNGLRLTGPGPDDGIGWLLVRDMGLGNLTPGQPATMNYLQFSACVSWPKSDTEQMAEADAASLDFNALDQGLFDACGLDMAAYELNARFLPRRKNIDIDGNRTTDVVAQIVRRSDGARGLALCRNASGVEVFGFDTGDAGPDLRTGYVGQTEAWQWVPPDGDPPVHLTGYDLPNSSGGHLVLERVEKAAVVLFWHDGSLNSMQMYSLVEP